jgi:hypothetical protein
MLVGSTVCFIGHQVEFHSELLEDFLAQHGDEYRTIKRINPSDGMKESESRNLAV